MRLIRNLGIILIVLLACNSCFKAPEYPVIPQITFSDIYFGAAKTSKQTDSLVLSLNFKDGDGDLGLSDADSTNFEYINGYYFIINSSNQVLFADKPNYKLSTGSSYVNFAAKRKNASLSVPDATSVTDWSTNSVVTKGNVTVPDFVTPYSCTNWVTTTNSSGNVVDTVYVQYNPNYFNIYIDFYFKDTDGTLTKFDPTTYFIYPNCSVSGFNGRFPILSKDLTKASPLDGVIHYTMKSAGFKLLFSTKTIQIQVSIKDRALHQSNLVTYDFTIPSITK